MLADLRLSSRLARCDMSHSRWLVRTAVVAALVFTLAPPAAAVWPVNPKVNLPVCVSPAGQYSPLGMATDDAGGAYVAWSDGRNGNYDIFVQRLRGAGHADPAWPVNGFAAVARSYDQVSPQLVPDAAGGALMVWGDAGSTGYSTQLYAHRLLPNGTLDPAWPAAGRKLSSTTSIEYSAVCIPDGNGGVAVAWTEARGATGYDIYVQRVSPAGALSWGATALLACGVTGDAHSPAITTDWAGGAVVAWQDYRKASGNDYDVYATRVLVNGTLDSRWTAGGVALCTLTGNQGSPGVLTDQSGGAFVAWPDGRSGTRSDVYATHVRGDGTLDPAWPANGRLVHAASGGIVPMLVTDGSSGFLVVSQDSVSYVVDHVLASGVLDPAWPVGGVRLPPMLGSATPVSDGAGGLVLVYEDYQRDAVRPDIGAHRVYAHGVLDSAWPATGRPLCTDPAEQYLPAAVTDGAGGAIAAWLDGRNLATNLFDVYAQRVRWTGVLGVPEPHIGCAADVRGDQGGRLLLAWSASEGDAAPNPYVSRYHVWRRIDAAVAASRAVPAAVRVPGEAPRPGDVRAGADAAGSTWWEFLATVPAAQLANYALTVTTTADSLPGWVPWNVFVVDAEDNTAWAFYSSPADSGYSADNVAPPLTAPAFGEYTQGMAHLRWPPSPAPDFKEFRLYRSPVMDFSPGPENFVAALRDTEYLDFPGTPSVYILQAVDVHGNASPNGLIVPLGVLDAGGPAPPKALAFRGAHPNPARGGAAFAFDLPGPAAVRVRVFDVAGRCVRELRAELPAGSHRLAWDARDAAGGAAAPGLYLARFEAPGYAKVARFVLTR